MLTLNSVSATTPYATELANEGSDDFLYIYSPTAWDHDNLLAHAVRLWIDPLAGKDVQIWLDEEVSSAMDGDPRIILENIQDPLAALEVIHGHIDRFMELLK